MRLKTIILVGLTLLLSVLNFMIFFDVRESETLEQEQEIEVEHALYIYETVVETRKDIITT